MNYKLTLAVIMAIVLFPVMIAGFIFSIVSVYFKAGMDVCSDFESWMEK